MFLSNVIAILLLLISNTSIEQIFRQPRVQVSPIGVSTGPTYQGREVMVDLPIRMQLRNKSGIDGAGLCVDTSAEMTGEYQNCEALRGFRDYCTKFPGGSYPDKFDQMIKLYAASRNLPLPPYIQHTGGDPAFLKQVLATGRMPDVSYAGHDGVHYKNKISHMVCCVYLDDAFTCLLDNNYPGEYLWMPTSEFVSRWKECGGWAIAILTPPPPPVPQNMKNQLRLANYWMGFATTIEMEIPASQCPDGKCPFARHPKIRHWVKDIRTPDQLNLYDGYVQIGAFHLKKKIYLKLNGDEWDKAPSKLPLPIPEALIPKDQWLDEQCPDGKCPFLRPQNFGMESDKFINKLLYRDHRGRELNASDALIAINPLPVDQSYLHLTWSGDSTSRAKFDEVAVDVPNTTLIQSYDPLNWAVADIKLPVSLVCQAPDGSVLFRYTTIPTSAQLVEALRKANPAYDPSKDKSLDDVIRKPAPAPVPPITPVEPVAPVVPIPVDPAPTPPASPVKGWHILAFLGGLLLFSRRK